MKRVTPAWRRPSAEVSSTRWLCGFGAVDYVASTSASKTSATTRRRSASTPIATGTQPATTAPAGPRLRWTRPAGTTGRLRRSGCNAVDAGCPGDRDTASKAAPAIAQDRKGGPASASGLGHAKPPNTRRRQPPSGLRPTLLAPALDGVPGSLPPLPDRTRFTPVRTRPRTSRSTARHVSRCGRRASLTNSSGVVVRSTSTRGMTCGRRRENEDAPVRSAKDAANPASRADRRTRRSCSPNG
jgi:hypothetical protein